MGEMSVLEDARPQQSSPCNSESLTDGSCLVSQASTDMLGDFNTDGRLLDEAVIAKDGSKQQDREVLKQEDGRRRKGQAGAVTQCLDHTEGDTVTADIAEVHGHAEPHNNVTTLHPSAPKIINVHARETLLTSQLDTASHREGQGTRAFEEWTFPEMIEKQVMPSPQPNSPLKQEVKVSTMEPSWDRRMMRRCDFQGKESNVQEDEETTESYRHDAAERDVQTPPMVTEASENTAVVSRRDNSTESLVKQAGEEEIRDNALAGVLGWQRINQAGSGECGADLDDAPLLPNTGAESQDFTVIECEVSLAGEERLGPGGGQPEACAANSELKEVSVSCHTSDTRFLTEAVVTTGCVEQECPVCTELFDLDTHKQALLNCNHSFCASCVRSIMERATVRSSGHIRCPVCRQTTPMPQWEIRQLQEEMSFLNGAVCGRVARLAEVPTRPVPAGRLCDWLEQGFQQRMMTTRRCGYLPCLRYPSWLVTAMARCDHRCPCCYLCVIFLLYGLELLCLSLIFIPVIILILLFTLLGKE